MAEPTIICPNCKTEIKELDREIRLAKKDARQAPNLDSKATLHKKVKELERRRNEKRRNLYEAWDDIDGKKENLISEIEGRLKQKTKASELFTMRWRAE